MKDLEIVEGVLKYLAYRDGSILLEEEFMEKFKAWTFDQRNMHHNFLAAYAMELFLKNKGELNGQ
jgi:hypothetical protein